MKDFDLIFNCMYLAILGYQVLYFWVQYAVLKRIELFYYSMFLLISAIIDYVYVLPGKVIISFVSYSNQFMSTFFYLLFLTHYLELQKTKERIYYFVRFYKYYNLFFIIVFMLLNSVQISGQLMAIICSVLSQPFNIVLLVMLWRHKGTYAKIILSGTFCTLITLIIYYALQVSETNTYKIYSGSPLTILQIGVMVDIFILGYGLSLKAAESDKKLVKILLENQQIVEVERSRLAKDLHDGLGGLLSGIKLTLHSISDAIPQKIAPAFSKVINQLDTVIKEMRRVAHNMMPEALLKFGLGEAIRDYCDGINESNIIKIKYTQIGSLQALIQSTAIVLYRIVQELTNNSIKHAAAKNIFIQITSHQKGYTITVEDDGKGFDIKTLSEEKGTGLKNVRSRVEYLRGSLITDSEQGKGTSNIIEIPNNNS